VNKAFPRKKGISQGVHLIRYADDMIITGRTKEMLYKARDIVKDFLEKRGVQLNENQIN